MFKLKKNKEKPWRWALYGKHPVASDFLSLGSRNELTQTFSKWVEKGFGLFEKNKKNDKKITWRFWAKGPNLEFICGIIHYSADKIGRRYPVLIIGSGHLQNWTRYWHMIPSCCQSIWSELERIPRNSYDSVEHLRDTIEKLSVPESSWIHLKAMHLSRRHTGNNRFDNKVPAGLAGRLNALCTPFLKKDVFALSLGRSYESQWAYVSTEILAFLQSRTREIPGVVFLNPPSDMSWLVYLQRSLSLDDFRYIWSDDIKRIDYGLFTTW